MAGYLFGNLSGADAKALLSQAMDGGFKFLETQGPYASFAIVMSLAFGGLAVWAVRLLVNGKQVEIDRIAGERDKFQKLFIDQWNSTMKSKVGGKK